MLRIAYPLVFLIGFSAAKAQVTIQPDNNNIVYWGRIDFTNPKAPAFEYPGITIKAKFTGTSVKARLHDYAYHGATTTNYFYRIIDGGTPLKFEALAGANTYTLATGLSSGSHTVEIIKLTEANVGKTAFLGFILDNGQTVQPFSNNPACSIEFIGNSITCGYGNEVSIPASGNPGTGFHSVNENNYKAWGYVAAHKLGFKYRAIAYSGRGLYRNNTGSTTGTLPAIYDRIYPDQAASVTWNHTSDHPDFIVIDLGTNDFAPDPANPVNQNSFETTYVNFVKKLIGYNPNATIVLAVGVMMGDGYPSGAKQWTRIRTYVKNVQSTLKNAGYQNILYLEMAPQSAPYGEDYHPSIPTHERMANNLITLLGPNPCHNVATSLEKEEENSVEYLFPNPAEHLLHIPTGDGEPWVIADNTGQELLTGRSNIADISSLSSGLYLIRVKNISYKFSKR